MLKEATVKLPVVTAFRPVVSSVATDDIARLYRLPSALRATLAASVRSSSCRVAVAQGCLSETSVGRSAKICGD